MRITVTNQKGGVGKTTLTYHLAHLFSKEMNTLVVDIDPQGNLTNTLLGKDEDGRYIELKDENNIKRLFENKSVKPIEVKDKLFLVGSDITLSGHEGKVSVNMFLLLDDFLSSIDNDDTLILIDTPPNLSIFTSNALFASENIIIPLDSHIYSVKGLESLLRDITSVKRHNSKIKVLGLLLTQFISRNKADREIQDLIESKYPNMLLDNFIPATTKMKEATGKHLPIFDYEPTNKASLAYLELFKEIKKKIGRK
jgi:chromosome partitioning protein